GRSQAGFTPWRRSQKTATNTRWQLRISERCLETTTPRRLPSTWPKPTKTSSRTRLTRTASYQPSSPPRPTRPSMAASALNGARANTDY
ncbi:uncharacterized protein METZ01_LOCUS321767, partial [marine metagenome]